MTFVVERALAGTESTMVVHTVHTDKEALHYCHVSIPLSCGYIVVWGIMSCGCIVVYRGLLTWML